MQIAPYQAQSGTDQTHLCVIAGQAHGFQLCLQSHHTISVLPKDRQQSLHLAQLASGSAVLQLVRLAQELELQGQPQQH
jgi:hypothetical protein